MGSIRENTLFLGIGGHAVALDPATGEEIWRRKLKGGGATFTGLTPVGERLLVTVRGELFCLDRTTGEPLWHEPLKGLGQGIVTVALAVRLCLARRHAPPDPVPGQP